MASSEKHGDKWHVRWREPEVTRHPDGTTTRRWRQRKRVCPTRRVAEALLREVREAKALGKPWVPESETPTATLGGVALAYIAHAHTTGVRESTQRFRAAILGALFDFAEEETSVRSLSLSFLDDYCAFLAQGTNAASTRFRQVGELERMWKWAHERSERFPGVPAPQRLTPDLDRPDPIVPLDTPDWTDADAMISRLDQRAWHRRVALVQRYHGLRVSQVLSLRWVDVNLERALLYLHAGRRGAKKGRTRVVPLHTALAREMCTWDPGTGLVFRRANGQQWRGDALVEPFRRAWRLAGVSETKWGATEYDLRRHGRPTHALRACVRVGLVRAGVEEAVALYYVGHAEGFTTASYVPTDRPETSPYWSRLLAASERIPVVEEHALAHQAG